MKPEASRTAFETLLLERGIEIAALTLGEGVRLMLEFYREDRAEGVRELDEDGDMLLFGWATVDWGKGEHFEIEVCRQLIEAALAGDDAISQLRLVFSFPPTDVLLRLKDGARWCDQPKRLSEFELFILENKAYQVLAMSKPETIELVYHRI